MSPVMWTTVISPDIFWSICIPSSCRASRDARRLYGVAGHLLQTPPMMGNPSSINDPRPPLMRVAAVSQDQAGDVVALGRPLRKGSHRSKQALEHGVRLGPMTPGHGLDQP